MLAAAFSATVSPHTRGWTLHTVERRTGDDRGAVSPHTRGWTRVEHDAGPLSDRRRVSPHTRGWTRLPIRTSESSATWRFPRTRGDGTPCDGYPRRRPRPGFPRTRGDGPSVEHRHGGPMTARFPRTRGDGPEQVGVRGQARSSRFPRTRGDGPGITSGHRGRPAHGFPAHAGMDPRTIRRDSPRLRRTGFPRTRGDGPATARSPAIDTWSTVSPHTRGWTRLARDSDRARDVLVSPHTRGWTLAYLPVE